MFLPPSRRPHAASGVGFSLLELLVSVTILTLLMGAVFSFMYQAQKRFQGNSVTSESNQSARAAMEVMTQEIGQAGYNPQFGYDQASSPNKTASTAISAQWYNQCLTLNDIKMINPGDWLQVDTGANEELVQVTATSNTATACSPNTTVTPPPTPPTPTAPWIQAAFRMDHTPSIGIPAVIPLLSYKFPYPTGILVGTGQSDDHTLLFYGDMRLDANGTISYVKYSLSPTTTPATTLSITTGSYQGTYTLYNLYRSVTTVGFPSTTAPGTNSPASVIVENVLYNTSTLMGPAGQAIFAYPQEYTIGVVPNQITVLGTLVITLSVAINPRSMESGFVQWYTMATQIRPLNLAAAVAVNQAGGFQFMAKKPNDLPMNDPTNYYQ